MGILIRASAFIAGWAVFYAVLAGTASTGEGANIGAGLLAFALTAGAAGGWVSPTDDGWGSTGSRSSGA